MKGKRLADCFDERPEFRWDEVLPGDYWKESNGNWFFMAPSGEHGSADSRWTITEHDDNTITVHPSLFFNTPKGWHGFLERGVWRQV